MSPASSRSENCIREVRLGEAFNVPSDRRHDGHALIGPSEGNSSSICSAGVLDCWDWVGILELMQPICGKRRSCPASLTKRPFSY